jgi:hypothetical protein
MINKYHLDLNYMIKVAILVPVHTVQHPLLSQFSGHLFHCFQPLCGARGTTGGAAFTLQKPRLAVLFSNTVSVQHKLTIYAMH